MACLVVWVTSVHIPSNDGWGVGVAVVVGEVLEDDIFNCEFFDEAVGGDLLFNKVPSYIKGGICNLGDLKMHLELSFIHDSFEELDEVTRGGKFDASGSDEFASACIEARDVRIIPHGGVFSGDDR